MGQLFLIGRRAFVQSSAAALALAVTSIGEIVHAAEGGPSAPLGPKLFPTWLEIGSNGTVTFICPEVEYGQATSTALGMLIAEELEIDWTQYRVVQSGNDPIYANPRAHRIATIGSNAIRGRFDQMRRLGATAREMLKQAAAARWKVPLSELRTGKGLVIYEDFQDSCEPSGHIAGYGELSAAAAALPVPQNVALKKPHEWRLIGSWTPRIDITAKCTGQAKYGLDRRVPNMLHAAVLRSPVMGGTVKSVDGTASLAREGVKAVENLGYGVAVVAEDSWTARRALEDVKIVWDDGKWVDFSSESQAQLYADALSGAPGPVAKNTGDVEAAAKMPGVKVLELEFTAPHLHHMCMEPQNATVWAHDGVCEVWAPTNGATSLGVAMSFVLDIPLEKVTVTREEFIGGSFGRRDRFDQHMEAAQLSRRLGAPIQVVQRRENDVHNGFYRPYQKSTIKGVIDGSGKLIGWRQKIASQAIAHAGFDLSELVVGGVDKAKLIEHLRAEGNTAYDRPFDTFSVSNTPFNDAYAIANVHIEQVDMDGPARPTYWRSVGQSINVWEVESFLDEAAELAKVDPVIFRKSLLGDHPRGVKVLDELAGMIGWKYPQAVGQGSGWGLAFMYGFDAYGAIAVQVTKNGRKLKIPQVVCVIDQGVTVNLNQTQSQMEGGIIDGLATTLRQQITLKGGRVQQSNWGDYPTFTLKDAPPITVKVLESREAPGSISEMCTPLVMAALTNAVYVATGTRIRELPLTKHGFDV